MSDPGWTPYVFTLFADNELVNGAPKVGGLERVARHLFGDIIEDVPKCVFCDLAPDRMYAVVERTLRFAGGIVGADIADANLENNAETPYRNYPTAIASTRAKARALRNALGLIGVVAHDEIGFGDFPERRDSDPITETQIQAINQLCKRLNINVKKLLEGGKDTRGKPVEKITFAVGQAIKNHLSDLQKDMNAIKDSLKGYDPNWRV